jgi:glycosyltransferase involved in cell wall biosynthesis
MIEIPVRLGVQQRVLPSYRVPFFDMLAQACTRGFSLFAGEPRPQEAIPTAPALPHGQVIPAKNRHFLNSLFYFCWQSGLMDWLESWQPEVLIVEANPRYLRTPSAVRWMHERKRPVIGWGLGSPSATGFLAGMRKSNRRRFLNQFDALIAYSHQGAAQYAALGYPQERIFTAINAVVPRPIHPFPQRQPLTQRKPILLYVGRLQSRKRLDLLLHACASLPANLQPELWLVGDGPERPGLEALSSQLFPARFTGSKFGEELDNIFQSADLFILPGTGGLAVQQAMSFGLPIIAAEGDGTQADLVRPSNGWQITPCDLSALTTALQKAFSVPEQLPVMGAASYEIVTHEANLEIMVSVFSTAIHSVLKV